MEVQVLSAAQVKTGVYVLLSEKDFRTYVGSTNNLDRRLQEHELGKVVSTRHRQPTKLIYFEETKDIAEARKLERYYKSGAGRSKLKKMLDDVINFQVPRLDSQANAMRSGSQRHK